MIKLKGKYSARRWLLSIAALSLLVAGLSPLMLAETVRAEDGEQAKGWKDITLLYTTDIKGKIEPCG